MLVKDYLNKNSHRIWKGTAKHRAEAFRRVEQFCSLNPQIEIKNVTAQHLYDFMDTLELRKGLSKASVNRYVAAVSRLLTHARKSGIPQQHFEIETHREKNRIRYFTAEELAKIDSYISSNRVESWFRDMCILARYTGLRHGEIQGLIKGINAHLERDQDGILWVELQDTKNGDDRSVPIIEPRAVQAALNLQGSCYSEKVFYRLWDRMRHLIAKGDKQFVFHVFRHTAASHMANELKLNSDIIGQWLGHRNPATTAKYIHIKPSSMRSIAADLAKSA